mgnify:FL=1
MGKYFNKVVKPVIDGSVQNTQFGDNDLLFDWTAFQIPKGSACIKGVTVIVRSEDGAATTAPQHLHLYFARQVDHSAPDSLGAANGSANGKFNYNALIGAMKLSKDDSKIDGLDYIMVFDSQGAGNDAASARHPHLVLASEDSQAVSGFETFYVACVHHGGNGLNFSTGVLLNQAGNQGTATVETTLTTDGTHAGKAFAIGDVIIDAANATIGTVTAIGGNTSITVDAVANGLDDDDELLVQSPVSLVFHCEK